MYEAPFKLPFSQVPLKLCSQQAERNWTELQFADSPVRSLWTLSLKYINFLKSLPFFFLNIHYMDSPDCYCYFWAYLFSTFSFSVLSLFSCRFRAVD